MAAWVYDEGMAQGSRARQEDDYGVFELPPELEAGDLLLVLADGMGGEQAGGGLRVAGFAGEDMACHGDIGRAQRLLRLPVSRGQPVLDAGLAVGQ